MNKILIFLTCFISLQLLNCKGNHTFNSKNKIFLTINKSLPNNWKYIEHYQVNPLKFPTGIKDRLWEPINIIYFYKTDYILTSDTPSVVLYFYSKSDELKLNKIIMESIPMSWCVPMNFAKSKDYIVITTPCDLATQANYKDSIETKQVFANIKKFIESN